MPDTQEKILSVEDAQAKIREESVFPGKADSDKTPAEIEAEEKKAEEEAQQLAEKEAEEKAELEAKEAEEKKAEEEAEAEQTRKEEEERLEKERIEKEEKFEYKSQEEAEKGAREAKRKMHEATAQAKALQEEIESLRKETSKAVKTGDITKKEGSDLKDIFVNMLTKINDLDTSDDDYTGKLADIWAKGLGEGFSVKEQERIAADSARKAKEDEDKSIVDKATTLAKNAGLEMDFTRDDKGNPVSTIDYDLFWAVVTKSKPVGETLEDRIEWVINEVKQKRTEDREKIINQQKILNEKQKKAQDKNKVLEKGVTITKEKEKDETPLSITDALRRVERRV